DHGDEHDEASDHADAGVPGDYDAVLADWSYDSGADLEDNAVSGYGDSSSDGHFGPYDDPKILPTDAAEHIGRPPDRELEPIERPDATTVERVREFALGGLESLGWQIAQIVSTAVSPLGPAMVHSLYLIKQVATAAAGLACGEGFDLKLGLPGFGP